MMMHEERPLTSAEVKDVARLVAPPVARVVEPQVTYSPGHIMTGLLLCLISGIAYVITRMHAFLFGLAAAVVIAAVVRSITAARLREQRHYELLSEQLARGATIRVYKFHVRRYWALSHDDEYPGGTVLLESTDVPTEYVYLACYAPDLGTADAPNDSITMHVIEPLGIVYYLGAVGEPAYCAGGLSRAAILYPDGYPRGFQLMQRHELPKRWQQEIEEPGS